SHLLIPKRCIFSQRFIKISLHPEQFKKSIPFTKIPDVLADMATAIQCYVTGLPHPQSLSL
ncbi:MAG: hypothetical protein ACYTX0_46990, partial [Nostoc sp.]